MFLLYICVFLFAGLATAGAQADDADALYDDRATPASASRAAELLTAAVKADPKAFDPAWKLARICYWLGGHGAERERRGFLEQGITAATAAAALEPQRPEGHFWMAANMGALGESFGVRAGLKYRKPIKESLETVLRLDPAYMEGSADRALGRWYYKVPRLFGGNSKEAEAHLRASLRYNPKNVLTHFFLAEMLEEQGRKAEARTELQTVLDTPLSREWAPEEADYKEQAKTMLAKMK
jgi:tetratricopeptide (TPR) repeat protein